MSSQEILDQRKNKFLKIGRNKGFVSNIENLSTLENRKNSVVQFFYNNKKYIYFLTGFIFLISIFLISFL